MIDRTATAPLAALALALAACSGGPAAAAGATTLASPLLAPPADEAFFPYSCTGLDPGDVTGDPVTGGAARDIVGDLTYPAFYRASDETTVYFRMRVSADPRKPGSTTELQPSSWDVLVDTDGDLSTYEYMLTADGNIGGTRVQWVRNTAPQPTNPSDPAETVIADLAPAEDHWAVQPTGDGSSFGGDADYFITLALPKALLVEAGLDLAQPFVVWGGTNAQTYALNSDFGCYIGLPPTLGDASNEPGHVDPTGHPSALPDADTTLQDAPVTTAVLANDFGLEDGPIVLTLESGPAHGTAAVLPAGIVRYTPAPGFFGTDVYTYRITDQDGETDTAEVTVTVRPGPEVDRDGDGIPDVGVRGGGCGAGTGGVASLLLAGAAALLRRRRAETPERR